jgi:4-hydroxy-4-methyl-2-oxoglutarate aldolase
VATDPRPIEQLASLRVALVADVLDRLGFREQVMDSSMRPRTPTESFAGTAWPVSAEPAGSISDDPYENEIAAVDLVPSGGVLVIAAPDCREVGIWGELLATRARQCGAVGAVIDGGVRDLVDLRLMDFPLFSTSISANDSRGRSSVRSHGEPVRCCGVGVTLGDFVLADPDGVVVVPAHSAAAVIEAAAEKDHRETLAREMLRSGASVADVWERHKVL